MCPKVRVPAFRFESGVEFAGWNIWVVAFMAWEPEMRIRPIAPPGAVAIAQIVSIDCFFLKRKYMIEFDMSVFRFFLLLNALLYY